MRILYVEDDPHHADLTVRALHKSAPQVRCETASTLREAYARLARLASGPLDLVLADMRLRDGNGLSLLRHIRESSLPLAVVLITGMGDEETAVAALKARADDYVVKHKDYLQRLPVILESALNHYRADAARRAHPLNILYAEDEFGDVESARRHFAVHADHLHLDAVFTGPEVLSALQTQDGAPRYDVLLMNFDLYGLKALEVLRELRLTHRQDVPVVLLCRAGDEELARQGLKLGASSYLVKSPGYLYQLPWELEEAHSRAELLRREAALQASEARNQAILNAIPDLMFLQSRDGTYLDYHARDISLLPAPPEQFLGKSVKDLMPPQLAAEFLRSFEQALAADRPVLCEYTLEVPDGVRAYEASIVSCDGDRVLSIVRDITERKQAEESLRESEEFNRRIVESSSDCIKILDLEGRLLYISQRGQELLGIEDPDAYLNGSWIELWPGEGRLAAREALEQAKAGGVGAFQGFGPTPQGQPKWWDTVITPMTDARGHVVRLLAVSRDITESKRAEESLKSALAEVRRLKDQLQEENIYLQEEVHVASNFGELIGRSEMLRRVLSQVEKVAPTGTTALILGETGTGKELLARAIHNLSPRKNHTLVKVNCAALPAQLIESELFGHEKGAFTGATAQRRGRFELADGGTIFLDEVGELPLDLQAKLLRVLGEGEFERVGSSRGVSVDVRVIAATNRRLEEAVQQGRFRSDLYYRLSVYPITLPPLRERREDIPILVRHFVKQLSVKMGKQIETIPHDAMNALQNYSWPGNIRELRNVIERAVIITRGATLRLTDDLESQSLEEGAHLTGLRPESPQEDYAATETLSQGEYNLILRTLRRVNWRVEGPGGAAALLDIHPSTLRTRMRKLGINRS